MRHAFAATLIAVMSATVADAQTPSTTRLIPYAGTALDASGSPLTGPVTLTFELYEGQDTGAPLWREVQRVNPDDRGRYLVYLGVVRALPQAAFTQERARWLAVSVNERPLPRVMLVAVPYALRAADADTLGGHPATSFVRSRADGRLETSAGVVAEAPVDGSGVPGQLAKFSSATTLSSSIISESATNRIGVGLPDPTGGGVVDSVFTIRNFDNNTGFAILNQTQQRRFALNTLATGGWALYDGGSSVWNRGLSQQDGRVVIGTSTMTPVHSFMDGRLSVETSSPGQHAIFARKIGSAHSAVQGRSGPGISGPIVQGLAGVPDSTQVFFNAGVQGANFNAGGYGILGAAYGGAGGARAAIYGYASAGPGSGTYAGEFQGDVTVHGTLTKTGGSFRIDHPLDPDNKYLSHSFVESPDMMNVYNGNVTLDASGEAWVTMPEWFEALNRDFRYQLTSIGAPGPNLYVAAKVFGNRFKIAGGTPGGEVSWQVTGVRQDAWANAHRIAIEQDKPESERGSSFRPNQR